MYPTPQAPRSLSTGLFIYRLKQMFKPTEISQPEIAGHPIIRQPVVIRPKVGVHTNQEVY